MLHTAFVIILLAWWVGTIWLVASAANKRGRSPWGWGVVAFLLGPFFGLLVVLPVVFILGTTERERLRQAEADEQARQRVSELGMTS
jgi:RsiW-degrading membrane proteinase PrsW (M82 family)